MAYTLLKSNNEQLLVLNDGIADTTATSLTLVGKNTSGYGSIQNENFVYLLENFAKSSQPRNPLVGQIWYDTNSNVLRPLVYDGGTWRPLAVLLYSNTSTDTLLNAGGIPLSAHQPGDLWFNSSSNQLFAFTATGQTTLIGPEAVAGFGTTKMSSTQMNDNRGNAHAVVQFVLDNEVLGVMSTATFVNTTTNAVAGFPVVYRGLTLKNYNTSTRYSNSSTDVVIRGLLDQLDTSYPRRNVSETINNSWTFASGIQVGDAAQSTISFSDASSALILNSPSIVEFQNNVNGLAFNGTSFYPVLGNGTVTLGLSTAKFGSAYIKDLNSGLTTSTITGNWAVNTTVYPITDLGSGLGSSTNRFNTIYATNVSAGSNFSAGTLDGLWNLTTSSNVAPITDLSSDLGSASKRFSTVYAENISVGSSGTPIGIIGSPNVQGHILPHANNLYNLGASNQAWMEVFANTLQTISATMTSLSVGIATVNTLTATTATVGTIVDSANTNINLFDTDATLAASSDNRLPTQRAVKVYVDAAVTTLNAAISSLTNSLTTLQFVPTGSVFHVAMQTAPVGYLVCDGTSYRTIDYPGLFGKIGYTYGGGGSYFYVPDLRGQFIRGWDSGGAVDPARAFGSTQEDMFAAHHHEDPYAEGGVPFPQVPNTYGAAGSSATDSDQSRYYTGMTGGTETRPKNVALLPIIKT